MKTTKKLVIFFILLKLQVTSRVSWYRFCATQKGKIIIHNAKTFSWSGSLQNVATCLRLQFNGYLKEDVNSDRQMETQGPFGVHGPAVATGVQLTLQQTPTFTHLYGSLNRIT